MHIIFVTGTAGSGKSLLTSALLPWYAERGAHAVALNLDPGATNLPYAPAVDVRDHINLRALMDSYMLGPNGALVMAADLIATRLPELQAELEELRADYLIVDTPGQLELFAYRPSGPYVVEALKGDGAVILFLFDATLVRTPANLVSIALLAASVQVRIGAPQVPVLSKRDLVEDAWRTILQWSSSTAALEAALGQAGSSTDYLLSSHILRSLVRTGFSFELLPVSATTRDGFVELSATLGRVLRGGEEVEE